MRTLLLAAATIGLSVGSVIACPYSKSVEADDKMTVASLDDASGKQAISEPDTGITGSVATEDKVEKPEK